MSNYRKILRTLSFGVLNAGSAALTVNLYKEQESATGFSPESVA